MLTISDRFSFNAVSNKGEGFDAQMRVRRLKQEELQATVKQLATNHQEVKSLLSTKKAAAMFSKLLGMEVGVFTSKLFTAEDFMKVNRTNILLLGEKTKVEGEYLWYLISVPESADPNQ